MAEQKEQPRKGSYASVKPTFKGGTKAIEDDIFYYGKDMPDTCAVSSEKILAWINTTYGMGERKSIESGTLFVGVDLPTNMTRTEFDALSWFKQEEAKSQFKNYEMTKSKLESNLGKLYSIIWGQCHTMLQNVLKAEKDFNEDSVIMLWKIIIRVCNSGTSKNCYIKSIDALLSFHLVSGDKFSNLSLYAEAFERKYQLLVNTGWSFASTEFRDILIADLEAVGEITEEPYLTLKAWKDKTGDKPAQIQFEKEGRALIDAKYKAHVFLRRSGAQHQEYRRICENEYAQGRDLYADDDAVTFQRLTAFKPTYVPKARPIPRGTDCSYMQNGQTKQLQKMKLQRMKRRKHTSLGQDVLASRTIGIKE